MIKQLSVLVLFVFSMLFSTLSLSSEMPETIRGSLCVVKADDKMVLVKEILTNKISLPGGTIDPGEAPSLTAQRETWEETGLVVTVGDVLGYTETAVIYDCISDSEVIAYDYPNKLNANEMPIWFAPHYGIEVSNAMLLSPDRLASEEYRYPGQWDEIKDMYSRATDQPVTFVRDLIDAAPLLNQPQLNWIVGLQQWVSSLPMAAEQTINSVNFVLSQINKPWLLLVLFPLVLWRFGNAFAYKLFFAITVTSLLSLVAQQGFNLARPQAYFPMFEFSTSHGFGFPNLSIAVWFSSFILIWRELNLETRKAATLCFSAVMLLLMISKFYSGTAFIWDSLFGAVLGALVGWHIIRLEGKEDVDLPSILRSKGLWISLSVVTVALSVIWPLPTLSYWLAVLITISGLVLTFDSREQSIELHKAIGIVAFLLGLNVIINLVASLVSYSSIWSLVLEAIRYPIIMLGYFYLTLKLSKRRSVTVKK
ncbi:NUDIX domain-containing protein [Vibrio sp. 10N.261.55.A7]|uniref:bifunctional NUDIX hydrolase/phosphatase PAP2 family protein n=1 Tax=Vibrio sp. 10N.261.55.A7 TaxID=1880851 RepID=UPI000CB28C27|nr:NUDIX domain-containing protein [Vibrio sp. 10N.261.55.A7]PMJ92438.1 DNA mismatch repair protein MutT [Vibrio sp. 10N.261.55.A7]